MTMKVMVMVKAEEFNINTGLGGMEIWIPLAA